MQQLVPHHGMRWLLQSTVLTWCAHAAGSVLSSPWTRCRGGAAAAAQSFARGSARSMLEAAAVQCLNKLQGALDMVLACR